MTPPTTAALDRPELARLWDRIAERLQRNGLTPMGVVVLDDLDGAERHALAGLLAQPVTTPRARIDLARLDARLRAGAGAGGGLIDAVDELRGPLVDRPGQRRAAGEERAALWASGREALRRQGLADGAWVEPWLDGLRRSGYLLRLKPPVARSVLTGAVRALGLLPALRPDLPPVGRGELASRVAGDAHALDDGSAMGATVLRAAALVAGLPPPATPVDRRAVWRAVGVLPDEVSATVLTFGLRPGGDDLASTTIRWRSDHGWESHLTLRDLRRIEWRLARSTAVYVCENPRVLEAAMDAGSTKAMVCTQGNPTVAVTSLVEALVVAGARLCYHGDFDWPGLAIANRMVARPGCLPWRMGVADYEAALAAAGPQVDELPVLAGPPVAAAWDPDLTPVMAKRGRAVHEELMLDTLVGDLTGPSSET